MEFALLLIHSGIPTLLIAPRNLAGALPGQVNYDGGCRDK